MQHAGPAHHRLSRMHLPARTSAPSTSASESGSSPRPSPVTLRNTFCGGSDLTIPSMSTAIGLMDRTDDLLEHVEPASEHRSEDRTRNSEFSEPAQLINASNVRNNRSSSVPSRPPKSAMAVSPSSARTHATDRSERKQTRFEDVDLVHHRRQSAPPTVTSFDRFLQDRATCSDDDNNDGSLDAAESVAALGAFDEIVDELIQVAEEHDEAREELANVAREVAETILEGISDDRSSYGHRREHESKTEYRCSDADSCSGRSSADEDVDESCFEPTEIDDDDAVDDDDNHVSDSMTTNHRKQPAILFLSEEGQLCKPTLESIDEEPSNNSSTETVKFTPRRRVSEPQVQQFIASKAERLQRRASMTDFAKLKGRLGLGLPSPKAGPAGCVLTACTVLTAESPQLNTVSEHPDTGRCCSVDKKATKTAQTLRSATDTFQILWEEPPPSSSSSYVTLLDSLGDMRGLGIKDDNAGPPHTGSAMDKVKTKLAAWSWAREQGLDLGEDGGPLQIPLLSFEDRRSYRPSTSHTPRSEDPVDPPNTERPSGASSAKQSAPHSPQVETTSIAEEEDEDEEDAPIELKVRATISRPPNTLSSQHPALTPRDYLDLPVRQSRSTPSSPGGIEQCKSISCELSYLAAEELHFKTHRNSVELLQRRRQNEDRMNQQLLNSTDSVILARSKLERYPRSGLDPRPGWSHVGKLSPIPDASPPDTRGRVGFSAMAKVAEKSALRKHEEMTSQDEAHPDEHKDCPIYEIERPRWFEANCKKAYSPSREFNSGR